MDAYQTVAEIIEGRLCNLTSSHLSVASLVI